jgi:hypothetical protein
LPFRKWGIHIAHLRVDRLGLELARLISAAEGATGCGDIWLNEAVLALSPGTCSGQSHLLGAMFVADVPKVSEPDTPLPQNREMGRTSARSIRRR